MARGRSRIEGFNAGGLQRRRASTPERFKADILNEDVNPDPDENANPAAAWRASKNVFEDHLALTWESGDARPPLPRGGIPPQRLPHALRRTIQITVLPFLWLEMGVSRVFQRILRPRYRLRGACKKRGACCRYLVMDLGQGRGLFGLFAWWTREVNGFFERGFEVGGGEIAEDAQSGEMVESATLKIHSCRHLRADGTCADYFFRPTVCRTWPRIRYFNPPAILKGCGFSVVDRQGVEAPQTEDSGLRIIN
jgi:Fe-S-cluster containining protein